MGKEKPTDEVQELVAVHNNAKQFAVLWLTFMSNVDANILDIYVHGFLRVTSMC